MLFVLAVFENSYLYSVLRSRSRLEPPLLGRLRSRFFCWPEPEPPEAFFLPGAGADPRRSQSAPGHWPSGAGAVQKSGSSATLPMLPYRFRISFKNSKFILQNKKKSTFSDFRKNHTTDVSLLMEFKSAGIVSISCFVSKLEGKQWFPNYF